MSAPWPPATTAEERFREGPYSTEGLRRMHEHAEMAGGGPEYDCGGWGYGTPCGGCSRCFHMMVEHYAHQWSVADRQAKKWGMLGYAPWAIDTEAVYHDRITGKWHGVGPSSPVVMGKFLLPKPKPPTPPKTEA